MSQVKMHIRKGGKTTMTVEGVPGQNCTEASRPYRERLAGQVTSDEATEEMNLPPLTDEQHEEQQQ
jgi:hypothetical protein